ncbi:hypothetical protein ACP179_01395 (plasmid) [Xenorhabdus stockiae]
MNGMPTSCFVYQLSPIISDNNEYRQAVIKALKAPCYYLTPLDLAQTFSGHKYPDNGFLTKPATDSVHILDCNKERPETFSTIMDESTKSILVIRDNEK